MENKSWTLELRIEGADRDTMEDVWRWLTTLLVKYCGAASVAGGFAEVEAENVSPAQSE